MSLNHSAEASPVRYPSSVVPSLLHRNSNILSCSKIDDAIKRESWPCELLSVSRLQHEAEIQRCSLEDYSDKREGIILALPSSQEFIKKSKESEAQGWLDVIRSWRKSESSPSKMSSVDSSCDSRGTSGPLLVPSPSNTGVSSRLWLILKYLITLPLIVFGLWSLLFIFWGQLALPGGTLFALIVLEIAAICAGHLASLLSLPPLTGMIAAGLILNNVPVINVAKDLTIATSSPLRGISVVILLSRGAFSVNLKNIMKFKKVVIPLALFPCAMEAIVGSFAVYYILGLPPSWAILIGCIFSAMSGAAVMPYLTEIEGTVNDGNMSLDNEKAIIVSKTACGLDAILAICAAECAIGFVVGNDELELGLLRGVAEVAMGGAFGVLWGGLSGLLLLKEPNQDWKVISLFCGGVMSLIGLYKIGYPRGGPLAVFSGNLIAVEIWRRNGSPMQQVISAYDTLWFIFQPLLFGILGSRVRVDELDWALIYKGCGCMVFCTLGRTLACLCATSWSNLPWKQRGFAVLAWLGKGTVQAALGPVALDTAVDLELDHLKPLGQAVISLAVLSIVVYSVVGFLSLKFFGHRLLCK